MAPRVRPGETITPKEDEFLAGMRDREHMVTHGTVTQRTRFEDKPKRDPAERPKLNADGYSEPEVCFWMDTVPIHIRSKVDEHTETRLYYAGAILIGCVNKSPLLITGHFDHNLGGQENHKFASLLDVHNYIKRLLRQEIK